MSRALIYMAVFFLVMNLFSGVVINTGIGETIGIEKTIGGGDAVDDSLAETDEVTTGAPTGSTLFGAYNALTGAVSGIAGLVVAAPTMLHQAGLPEWLTEDLLKPLIGMVYALGVISVFLRYRLT